MVCCLQIQPVGTIHVYSDVESEIGREHVAMFGDTAPTAMDPLGERLFPAVPTQAGLRQGSGGGVVLVEVIPAGACSLAANRLDEHPWCPVPHAAGEVLLPCDIIELLAGNVGAMGE